MKTTTIKIQYLVMYQKENKPLAEIIPANSLHDLWDKISWLMIHNPEFVPTHFVLPDGRRLSFEHEQFFNCYVNKNISELQLLRKCVQRNLFYVSTPDVIHKKELLNFEFGDC